MKLVLRTPVDIGQFHLIHRCHNTVISRLDVVRRLDEGLAVMVGEQVFDNARVAAGLLDDPRTMLKRLNDLLERTLGSRG
jgi:TNF receptor-associated protein 1